MRLATWNANSLKVRLPQVLDWLGKHSPDALCLQETKLEDAKFPRAEIEAAGFQVAFAGQKTYNGVAIVSRRPLSDVSTGFPQEQARLIAATISETRVICVYCRPRQDQKNNAESYKRQLGRLTILDRSISPITSGSLQS